MPPDPSYTTWDGTPAIFAEDKNLMRVRMGRVLHPDAWSQRPLWGTNHVVSNVIIEKERPNGDVIARSRFHMMELRRDDVRHFAGSYMHQLKKTAEGYRIKLQRVDMTNAQAAYDYVLQIWVCIQVCAGISLQRSTTRRPLDEPEIREALAPVQPV